MKKFLTKIVLYISAYIILMFFFRLLLPDYLGNEQFLRKMHYYDKISNGVNTVFIGNSLINRHVIPSVFDTHTDLNTYSYNIAADATNMMECSYLLEHFLGEYDVDRVFMLVNHSLEIREPNLHTLRLVYYHDWKRLRFSLKYADNNAQQIKYHLMSFMENQFSMFRIKALTNYKQTIKTTPPDMIRTRGFLAMDEEDHRGRPQAPSYAKSKNKFSRKLKQSKRKKDYTNYELTQKDLAIIEECNRLKKLVDAKGTELYFVFLPNSPAYYTYNLDNSVYLGDGDEFPEFFEFENRFNRGHLNREGAKIFSTRLAQAFNQKGS